MCPAFHQGRANKFKNSKYHVHGCTLSHCSSRVLIHSKSLPIVGAVFYTLPKGVSIRNLDENKNCIHPLYSSARRSFLLQIRRTSIKAAYSRRLVTNSFVRSFFLRAVSHHALSSSVWPSPRPQFYHMWCPFVLCIGISVRQQRNSPSGLCEETLTHGGSSCLAICNRRDPA